MFTVRNRPFGPELGEYAPLTLEHIHMAVGSTQVDPLLVLGAEVDNNHIQGWDWWTDPNSSLPTVPHGQLFKALSEEFFPDLTPVPQDRATIVAGYSGRQALVAVTLPRKSRGYDGAPIELIATTSNTTFGPLPATAEDLFEYLKLDVAEANSRGYRLALSPDVETRHIGVMDLDRVTSATTEVAPDVNADVDLVGDAADNSSVPRSLYITAGVAALGSFVAASRALASGRQ